MPRKKAYSIVRDEMSPKCWVMGIGENRRMRKPATVVIMEMKMAVPVCLMEVMRASSMPLSRLSSLNLSIMCMA